MKCHRIEELLELVGVDARHRNVRADPVDDQSQQKEGQSATQVAELTSLGQLIGSGCHRRGVL